MIVRSVTLENVKSFGTPAEKIDLTPGINAICGPNGAGKSTILEAIGCALFQHIPYKQEDFVREGESSGTISVAVDSSFDERTYEIVRRVGKGAAHFIHDPDLGIHVAEGDASVRRWLHQHLRLDDEVDLRALFTDSVGPPQGTLTAIFLSQPQVRKVKFDRLLRVDEYETAYRGLNALNNQLRDERVQVELALSTLEGEAASLAGAGDALTALRIEKAGLATRLSRLTRENGQVDEDLARFQLGERLVERARSDLELAQVSAVAAQKHASSARANRDAAALAQATYERTDAGAELFRQAEAGLRALAAQRRQRDALVNRRQVSERAAQEAANQVARLAEQIGRAKAAEKEMVELSGRIAEQEVAEAAVQHARDAVAERLRLRRERPDLRQQLARCEHQLQRIEQDLVSAETLRGVASELAARQMSLQQARQRVAEGKAAAARAQILRRQTRADQLKAADLAASIARLGESLTKMESAASGVERLGSAEANYRALYERQAGARTQLLHARKTRDQVAGGMCPFLLEACRNLEPGQTLETHFDREIGHWESEATLAAGLVVSAEKEVESLRRSAEAAARIPELCANLRGQQSERELVEARLTEAFAELAAADELTATAAATENAERAAQSIVEEAQNAARLVATIPDLQERRTDALKARDDWHTRVEASDKRLELLDSADALLADAEQVLLALGDPRGRRELLRREAAFLPDLRLKHDTASREQTKHEAVVSQVSEQLRPFAELDIEEDRWRTQRDDHQRDQEDHIRSEQLARTLPAREAELSQAQHDVQATQSTLEARREALEQAEATYDATRHAAATQRKRVLVEEINGTRSEIAAADTAEKRAERDLHRWDELNGRIESERERIDLIEQESVLADGLRRAIREAGPEVTRQLLRGISQTASRINAEIMASPGADLSWTETYDILVRHGADNRSFAQLSGGEQMSAALAVRLALLRGLSDVKVAFLDEPTAHLDADRRTNLGEQVQRLTGFSQLIVISHDDTFDGLFGHVIRIERQNGRSVVADQG